MTMTHANSLADRPMSSKDAPGASISTGLRNSSRAARYALNRILVASYNEIVALRAANRIIGGGAATTHLSEQARRRLSFQPDLAAMITRLGGTPAKNASLGARLAVAARRLHTLVIGPHEGDAYAACSRATERTANAYWKALKLPLHLDVRSGLEQQDSEVESDSKDLRRLRWGGGSLIARDAKQ